MRSSPRIRPGLAALTAAAVLASPSAAIAEGGQNSFECSERSMDRVLVLHREEDENAAVVVEGHYDYVLGSEDRAVSHTLPSSTQNNAEVETSAVLDEIEADDTRFSFTKIVVAGGEVAVSSELVEEVVDRTTTDTNPCDQIHTITRIAGEDRAGTFHAAIRHARNGGESTTFYVRSE